MTVNDIPLVAFFKQLLDPLIILGTLYVFTLLFGEPFNGYYLILALLATLFPLMSTSVWIFTVPGVVARYLVISAIFSLAGVLSSLC